MKIRTMVVGGYEDREINSIHEFLKNPIICVCEEVQPRHLEGHITYRREAEGVKTYIRYETLDEKGTVILTDELMQAFNLSYPEVRGKAFENMKKMGLKTESMANFISRMVGFPIPYNAEAERIIVASLDFSKPYGAGVMMMPCFMEEIKKKIGDFYILPASLHEIICVPADFDKSFDELKDMVKTVNAGVLEPDDIFTNDVFLWDGELHRM